MLNKVKEMGSTIGKKVVKNKKKIAIVAGGVAVGAYGVFVYKNVKGFNELVFEGERGAYKLVNFRDGCQLLDGGEWGVLSNGLIDKEAVIDAITHI